MTDTVCNRIQKYGDYDYVWYSMLRDAPDVESEIHSLILVNKYVISSQDNLDELADYLNSGLKCEGANLVPLYLFNRDTKRKENVTIDGLYLCLYCQQWG